MIDLPKKDKHGKSILSYSQINLFLKDKNSFYKTYILKEPFYENKYMRFGSKVDKAIQDNDYCLFTKQEKEALSKVTRLDIFQKSVFINFDEFYMVGFIDTVSSDLTELIDYKTGGVGKDEKYKGLDYTQLCYYAIGLKQETGITPKKASVEFITREAKNNGLYVSNDPVIKIDVDISQERLDYVYYETIKIAKDIEAFYLDYVKNVKSLK